MKQQSAFRLSALVAAMVLLGGLMTNINAQTRGEVTGFATGQIRKVEKSVSATTPENYNINAGRGEKKAEWVREAETAKKFTKQFEFGVKGGINGLILQNSAAMNENGLGNRQYSVNNSCKYYYEDTPRSERQNRVSWNVAAFARFNFGQGNLQAEVLFNENRYETVLINSLWSPDKRIMTGTIYDRSIDIPILIGWKYSIFRLYVGPQFRVWSKFNTANEGTFDYVDPNTKEIKPLKVNVENIGFDPNNPDKEFEKFGLQTVNVDHSVVHFAAGMSFEFANVVIDARYLTPFKRPIQEFYGFDSQTPTRYKLSIHTIQVALGVKF